MRTIEEPALTPDDVFPDGVSCADDLNDMQCYDDNSECQANALASFGRTSKRYFLAMKKKRD